MSKTKGTWYEVAQFSDALGEQVVTLPEGQRYTVRGPIEDVMIVQIPNEVMAQMANDGSLEKTLDALQTTVRGGGFEGGLLVVPAHLRFMKLRPVDRLMARTLEQRDRRQRVAHKKAMKEGVRDTEPPSEVVELRPDTKTAGEA